MLGNQSLITQYLFSCVFFILLLLPYFFPGWRPGWLNMCWGTNWSCGTWILVSSVIVRIISPAAGAIITAIGVHLIIPPGIWVTLQDDRATVRIVNIHTRRSRGNSFIVFITPRFPHRRTANNCH